MNFLKKTKLKKNFDKTFKISETGHRVFHTEYIYSNFSDYRVFNNGKELQYAKSLKKLQNKWRKSKSKEIKTLISKFYTSEFKDTFMVHKGGVLIADDDGNTSDFGAEIVLGGDAFDLKAKNKIRIVRKVKKKSTKT